MEILLLRFDAPLLSFGAPTVDNRGVIQPYPALSLMTGLLANALGYEHGDFDKLESLQQRLHYASRQDRRGEKVRDFQTVDFRQDFLAPDRAWTTRGQLEGRASRLTNQTHIRYRDYWADSAHTVAIALATGQGPTVEDLADAVRQPARPLFIGRKTCLPATPLYLDQVDSPSLRDALKIAPLANGADKGTTYPAWWPCEPRGDENADIARPITDRRDWRNQIHVGERWIAQGTITITDAGDDND